MPADLPVELLLQLVTRLSFHDLCHFRGACKRFRDCVHSFESHRFKTLDLASFDATTLDLALSFSNQMMSTFPGYPSIIPKWWNLQGDGVLISIDLKDAMGSGTLAWAQVRLRCFLDDCFGGLKVTARSVFEARFPSIEGATKVFLDMKPGLVQVNKRQYQHLPTPPISEYDPIEVRSRRDSVSSTLTHLSHVSNSTQTLMTQILNGGKRTLSFWGDGIIGQCLEEEDFQVNYEDTLSEDPFKYSEPPHDVYVCEGVYYCQRLQSRAPQGVIIGFERGEVCVDVLAERQDINKTAIRISSYLKMLSRRWKDLYLDRDKK